MRVLEKDLQRQDLVLGIYQEGNRYPSLLLFEEFPDHHHPGNGPRTLIEMTPSPTWKDRFHATYLSHEGRMVVSVLWNYWSIIGHYEYEVIRNGEQ